MYTTLKLNASYDFMRNFYYHYIKKQLQMALNCSTEYLKARINKKL